MSMGMSARMATMRMQISMNTHRNLMMDQRRMSRTKTIALESVNIKLYVSDL